MIYNVTIQCSRMPCKCMMIIPVRWPWQVMKISSCWRPVALEEPTDAGGATGAAKIFSNMYCHPKSHLEPIWKTIWKRDFFLGSMCVWLWYLAHRRLKCRFEASTIYDLNSATREVNISSHGPECKIQPSTRPLSSDCPNFRSTASFNLWLPAFRCPIFSHDFSTPVGRCLPGRFELRRKALHPGAQGPNGMPCCDLAEILNWRCLRSWKALNS